MSPDVSFVVEDGNGVVVGVSVAALDAKEFRRRMKIAWLDELRKKYPMSATGSCNEMTKDVITSIHSDPPEIPMDVLNSHPAELKFIVIAPLVDPSVPKRLVTCTLAALRANGEIINENLIRLVHSINVKL